MREIEMCRPRNAKSVIRRLRYFGDGTELAAWVGDKERQGWTHALYVHSFVTGNTRELLADQWYWSVDERTPDPVLSPDGRFVLFYFGHEERNASYLLFDDLTRTDTQKESWLEPLYLSAPTYGFGGLLFTTDGNELLAVQHDKQTGAQQFARDVARFAMATFTNPPLRYEERVNPLNGKVYQKSIYNERWRGVMNFPDGPRISAAALSANGRLLAVGEVDGAVHVARLKARSGSVIASFTPPKEKNVTARTAGGPKRKIRPNEFVAELAFSPDAKWVAWLARERLFARSLDGKGQWQTDASLAQVTDFAFHPSGNFLCAVSEDGQARYLDAHTGEVAQSFKWVKRAKQAKPLHSVAFAPDGLTCAAGGENGQVVVWDVDV